MKKYHHRLTIAFLATALGMGLGAVTVQAQQWPTKPIRMIVPNPPGGIADVVARVTSAWLTEGLGQTVLVENRAGASGAIAAEYVAKAVPDGYTLFFATMAQMAIVPAMRKTPYDPINDFAPVSMVASAVHILGVNNSSPAKTLQEFVQQAKANPGKVSYATAGVGSATHLAMAKFIDRAAIELLQIDYNGGGPAQVGLLGGQVSAYFGNTAELLQLAQVGKIRALAVASSQRLPALPNVPTVSESGYPGFRAELWVAVIAPAATPTAIINSVAAALAAGARDPAMIARLRRLNVDPSPVNSPAEFTAFLGGEIRSWGELIRGAKLTDK